MRIKTITILGLLILSCSSADKQADVKPMPFDPEYQVYASVLNDYVKGDLIDYKALKENRADLDSFIRQLAGLSLEEYDDMDQEEQKALWINAYNGIVLRSVIDAYPVKSINDIEGVWDKRRWPVGGERVTLDDIEHSILRRDFEDARVHFALSCASISGPSLAPQPFFPRTLEKQLDSAVYAFVNNISRILINPHNNVVTTSEIFSWFPEDFESEYNADDYAHLEPTEAAILNFIFSHADESILDFIDESAEWSIEYLPYNWSLNDVTQ